jgi:hypothetical protein
MTTNTHKVHDPRVARFGTELRKLDTCGSPSPIQTSDFQYSRALRCRAGVTRAAASRALLVPLVCRASEGIAIDGPIGARLPGSIAVANCCCKAGALVSAAAATTSC